MPRGVTGEAVSVDDACDGEIPRNTENHDRSGTGGISRGGSVSEIWYSYGEIQFYRGHVEWICDNSVTLRNGKWPTRPPTGYADAPGRAARVKTEGAFAKPSLVWTEVEVRLGKGGKDGHLAIGYYLGVCLWTGWWSGRNATRRPSGEGLAGRSRTPDRGRAGGGRGANAATGTGDVREEEAGGGGVRMGG